MNKSLLPGFASRTPGFFDDARVPFKDYSTPKHQPTYSNQWPLPKARNTYPDSDYDPSLLDSYSEDEVDRRSFRQRSFRQALLPMSILPDPVMLPTVTKSKFLIGLFEIIYQIIISNVKNHIFRVLEKWTNLLLLLSQKSILPWIW